MRNSQCGISLMGLISGVVILIVVALFGMKLLPSYMEYFTAKGAIESIARERQAATVAEIRRAFDARAQIDDIRAIKSSDLDISKEGGQIMIGFAYRKEVPLFANLGLYIDFAANSRGQ